MSRFEDSLRRALRREEAPPGFTERVLARVAEKPARASRWGIWRWAAAAALPLVLIGSFEYRAERRRRAEGEMAKAQVLTALQVAADKVEYAREKVIELTSGGGTR